MGKPARIYWDSCAWIGLLNGEPDKKRELEIVYGNARNGKVELWTSTLAMIECRTISVEKGTSRPYSEANETLISDIFKQPFVKAIPITVDIAEEARRLWRITPEIGKYQDAVHVASTLRWSVPLMHTYDRADLLGLSESLNCRDSQPLIICYPDSTTDGPLFGHAKRI